MIIKILAEGGNMKPNPALSQRLGPAGINMGQVISKVNQATVDFKGMKVPIELDIDTKTKQFQVHVSSPPVSALLKKEFNLDKASGDHKNNIVANASIEQIISISKAKMENMLSKDLKAAVKSVAGTCVSLGILIENKSAKEAIHNIDSGMYDSEISKGKDETPKEKRKELDEFFSKIKTQQELKKKQAEAEAEAAAAEKTAAAGETKPATVTEEKPKEKTKEKK